MVYCPAIATGSNLPVFAIDDHSGGATQDAYSRTFWNTLAEQGLTDGRELESWFASVSAHAPPGVGPVNCVVLSIDVNRGPDRGREERFAVRVKRLLSILRHPPLPNAIPDLLVGLDREEGIRLGHWSNGRLIALDTNLWHSPPVAENQYRKSKTDAETRADCNTTRDLKFPKKPDHEELVETVLHEENLDGRIAAADQLNAAPSIGLDVATRIVGHLAELPVDLVLILNACIGRQLATADVATAGARRKVLPTVAAMLFHADDRVASSAKAVLDAWEPVEPLVERGFERLRAITESNEADLAELLVERQRQKAQALLDDLAGHEISNPKQNSEFVQRIRELTGAGKPLQLSYKGHSVSIRSRGNSIQVRPFSGQESQLYSGTRWPRLRVKQRQS